MLVLVSLPLLIGYSLALSGVLAWMAARGGGIAGASAATALLGAFMLALEFVAYSLVGPATQAVRTWTLSVLLPSALLLAVSRFAFLQARPLVLMLVGPLAFLFGLVVAIIVYNVMFATGTTR